MKSTNPPTETVSVVQSEHTDCDNQSLALGRFRWVEGVFTIGYSERHWCRKYNSLIYGSRSNIVVSLAASPERADSLAGNPARPATAGYALHQTMIEYATSQEYSISAYENTASQDPASNRDRGRGIATDGGTSLPVESNRCGASSTVDGVCRQPVTHEVEVNAPCRGHAVDHRCAACAEKAQGRLYVRDVRPITLEVDTTEAAAAIYDHYRYTQATHAQIGYKPSVRVVPEEKRFHVSRGSILHLDDRSKEAGWRRAHILLEDAPDYFEVTRPTWADTSDWLEAASACVQETVTDVDGWEWSLPTAEIAEALREGRFLEEADSR